MVRTLLSRLSTFHDDEQGDEGVNKILIIAMIAIPLILVLIFFGGEIVEFFQNAWNNLTGTSTNSGPDSGWQGGGG